MGRIDDAPMYGLEQSVRWGREELVKQSSQPSCVFRHSSGSGREKLVKDFDYNSRRTRQKANESRQNVDF